MITAFRYNHATGTMDEQDLPVMIRRKCGCKVPFHGLDKPGGRKIRRDMEDTGCKDCRRKGWKP